MGVNISCGSIKYSAVNFSMDLKVVKNDDKVDGNKALFEQYCKIYGFEQSDYNREFTSQGKRFKLVGFNPKSPKNCCSIYCITDGNTYKCPKDMVQYGFLKEK